MKKSQCDINKAVDCFRSFFLHGLSIFYKRYPNLIPKAMAPELVITEKQMVMV